MKPELNNSLRCELNWASYYGHLRLVKFLLDGGARSKDALYYANQGVCLEVVKLLKQYPM